MQGIMRKKYGMGHTPKTKHVQVKVSSKTVKKTIKKMKTSSAKIDKARMEVYRLQKNLRRRETRISRTMQEKGIQESLIQDMYTDATNYDVKSISTVSQANRIKKEIQEINKQYDKATLRINRDIKKVEAYKKESKNVFERRNDIMENFMNDADPEEVSRIRGDVFKYDEREVVAGITGNPTRYYDKENYEKGRKSLQRLSYDPYYRERIYRKNVEEVVRLLEHDPDMDHQAKRELARFKKEFFSMDNIELMAFVRLNVDNMARFIFYADAETVRSNFKRITDTIKRVKRANR